MHWIEKVYYYLHGRYGRFDELSKVLLLVGLLVTGLSNFFDITILVYVGIGLAAFGLLRPTSKDKVKRQEELAGYYRMKRKASQSVNNIRHFFTRMKPSAFSKKKSTQQADKAIIACPNCGQKLRIPTGKTLQITCQSCKFEFRQKT